MKFIGNNIGTFKRGRCLLMMSNPERCTDLFFVIFKLDSNCWFKWIVVHCVDYSATYNINTVACQAQPALVKQV